MRDCAFYREWISAGLDGPVEASRREGLDLHLASCPSCRRARDQMAEADELLRALEAVRFSPGFEERLEASARAISRRPAISRRWALGVAIAAVLLVGLGVWIAWRPPEARTYKRQVEDHVSAIVPFVEAVYMVKGENPAEALAFLRAEEEIFDVKRRTGELKRLQEEQGASATDLKELVTTTEKLVSHVEQGAVAKLPEEASRARLAETMKKIEKNLNLQVRPPQVKLLSFSPETPLEVQTLVRGHVALKTGHYDQAVLELSKAADAAHRQATVWLAEAHRQRREPGEALVFYVTALAKDRGASPPSDVTRGYVAQAITSMAVDYKIYINDAPAWKAEENAVVKWISEPECTISFRPTESKAVRCYVASEGAQAMRALASCSTKGDAVRYCTARGVATAEVDLKRLAGSLDPMDWEKLRSVEALRSLYEEIKPRATPSPDRNP